MKLYPGHEVELVRGMENPFHYRHKVYATFHGSKNRSLTAGLYQEHSHNVIDSSACLIQNETANQIIADVTAIAEDMHIHAYHEDTGSGVLRHLYVRVSHAYGTVMLVIVIGSRQLPGASVFVKRIRELHPEIETIILNYNSRRTSMVLGKTSRVLYGPGYIFDELSGFCFRISPQSFFQVNPEQTEVLYQTALELADLTGKESVLDVCSGIGTITLLASRHARSAIGVESVRQAVEDAKDNAVLNRVSNVKFICDDIQNYVRYNRNQFDVIIADPPRSGLGVSVSKALAECGAQRIVYISCNPVTQAQDCDVLKKAGYSIEKIVPVDLFCFTDHVETVCLLTHTSETVTISRPLRTGI